MKHKVVIFLLIYFSFFVAAFVFQSIPPLLPSLEKIFALTSLKSGLLMSVYSILGIIIGFFCANLLRRFKPGNLIIIANSLTLIGLIIPLYSKTFNSLLFGRIFSGGGMSLLTILSPSVISRLFKVRGKSSQFLGIFSTGMPVATISAFYLLPTLEERFGQFFFLRLPLILSVVTLLFAILFYYEGDKQEEEIDSKNKFNWRLVIPLSILWLLFNAGVLSFITFTYSFAIEKRFLSYNLASTIGSSTMIGGLFLGTFIGNLLDRKKSLVSYFITIGCFLISLGFVLFYFSSLYVLTIILLIIGGGMVPTAVFSSPHIFNLKPFEKTFGIIAAFLGIGSFLGPFLVGILFNRGEVLNAFLLEAIFLISAGIIGITCLRQVRKVKE